MTLAITRRTNQAVTAATAETVELIQNRRRSNAAGLHFTKPRGGRQAVDRLAIRESFMSFGEDDE
jgi:hypothetical protein